MYETTENLMFFQWPLFLSFFIIKNFLINFEKEVVIYFGNRYISNYVNKRN